MDGVMGNMKREKALSGQLLGRFKKLKAKPEAFRERKSPPRQP